MNRISLVVLFLLLSVALLPAIVLPDKVYAHPTLTDADGDGLLDIWDVDDLQDMNLDLTEDYELRANIDASATSGWNGGAGFLPVGDAGGGFTGSLEGNDFTIDSLYIANSGSSYIGMFGYLQGSEVQNVNMTNAYVEVSIGTGIVVYQGILVGYLGTSGTVSSCSISGEVVTLSTDAAATVGVGGAVGVIELSTGIIEDTSTDIYISVTSDSISTYVGGVVGLANYGGNIVGCSSSGTMNVNNVFGGGATPYSVGGILGYYITNPLSGHPFTMSDCHSTVGLEVEDYLVVGGVIGLSDATGGGQPVLIELSSYVGNIVLNNAMAFGNGFAGQIVSGTVNQCFSSGTITNIGTPDVDGIAIGFVYNTSMGGGDPVVSEFNDCYSTMNFVGSPAYAVGWGGVIGTEVVNVNNVYDACLITGGSALFDGFIHTCGGNEVVSNSFWDTQTTGDAASCAGTGKTTAQMKTESTFTGAGWDFVNIWDIDPAINNGYPYLQNNSPAPAPGPDPPVAGIPTVTTNSLDSIDEDSVIVVGTLVDEGYSSVIELGFCYGTSTNPTISGSTSATMFSIRTGDFYRDITSLSSNTLYYIRTFATNSYGTGYGSNLSFRTLPSYSEDLVHFSFQPAYILPPSSPGTIMDLSPYGNNASYILDDMVDGITVYVGSFLAGMGFYPSQGDTELPTKWVVPPQSGMNQQKDPSNLPLYDLFSDSADRIGMDVAYLYIMMTFGLAMGLGFLFFLISGNILVSIIAMIVMLSGFFSAGVMPLWIIIFFAAFAIGLIYVSKQT